MRNNKKQSSHSHHNHGDMDHSKHDHNEMEHSQMDHSNMNHSEMDHGAMGGHAHHHHGSFKEIFLKSLPLGIVNLTHYAYDGYSVAFPNYLSLCRRCSSWYWQQFYTFLAENHSTWVRKMSLIQKLQA